MYNPYQQQQTGFNNQQQQTGFAGGYPNQQQFGQPQQPGFYPQPQLQNQATGFYPQQFQQQQFQQPQFQQPQLQQTGLYNQSGLSAPNLGQQPLQSQATGFVQPQATGFIQPQATGFIQPQKTGFSQAVSNVSENNDLKIPSIRLSFITVADQTKFEHLFRTAVPKGEQAINGDTARDILLRSGLQPVTLAEIWSLADTNKSGSLLFPEFALALHLCNLSLKGDSLPAVLPEKWRNEVQSFVDAISFSVPEDPSKVLANTPFSSFSQSLAPQTTGFNPPAPPTTSFTAQPTGGAFQPVQTGFNNFANQQPPAPLNSQRTGGGSLIPLQPQQTAGLIPTQKTGPLQAQTTGFQNQLPAQKTGPLQQQTTGFQPQATGFQSQNNGFQPQATGLQPQTTGFQPQTTGFQPQATGFQPQATGFQPQATGFQPQTTGFQPQQTGGYLQSQPTGKPGQWGFVSTPTGGIPGLNAMQEHFLPSSQLPSNNLQNVMGGSLKTNVTWAITKQEKQIYDGIFSAWDKSRKGFIDGDVAISIFGKSGLGRPDLESIWNLVDSNNRGKLNKDEFAVAMHLVYRRLNGFELPLRLPPELIPPSTKYLQDSMDSLKNSLKGGGAVKPAKPAPLKAKTDGSRFKNNDEDVGYVSSSRHRRRSNAAENDQPKSSVKTSRDNDLTIDDLKKLIREKQILLDALDAEDQDSLNANKSLDEKNYRDIEFLKSQIKNVQMSLNDSSATRGSFDEKKQLLDKLNYLTRDRVPGLISKIHAVNKDIAKQKVELYKLRLSKENPDWSPDSGESGIVGTGPNGEVTDYDRKKFKSKQLLKQRMAALTGKSASSGSNKDLDSKLQQESEQAQKERENQSNMINDIEGSIRELEDGAAAFLHVSTKDEVGSNKWENGTDVSSHVAAFIRDLKSIVPPQSSASVQNNRSLESTPQSTGQNSSSSSLNNHSSPEDRAAYIKAQAEKRMQDRLAKLGISRPHRGSPSGSSHRVNQFPSSPSQDEPPKQEPPKQEPPKQEPPKLEEPKSISSDAASVPAAVPPSATQESSDDEDEEYVALMKQKQEMETRENERKLKKKQEKEARLAKLKKEMEEMKKREQKPDSDDDWDDATVPQAQTYKPTSQKSSSAAPTPVTEDKAAVAERPQLEPTPPQAIEKSQSSELSNNAEKEDHTKPVSADQAPALNNNLVQQPHSSNPFAKMQPPNEQNGANSGASSRSNTNPFFKSAPKEASIDPKKAEAQRASQRGLDDNDWSDDDENSSDDEGPNRAGAAKLASLLFGGMSQPPARTDSSPSEAPDPPAPAPAPEVIPSIETNQTPPPPTTANDDFDEDSDDQFATPPTLSSQAPPNDWIAPPVPPEAPPIPSEAPPIPSEAPPIPSEAPPIPSEAPPIPSSIPPPPPPPASFGAPPPAPPLPPPSAPSGAPPAPPPPPPALPSQPSSSGPPLGGAPDIGALLGQIQGGKSLKKVDETQKRIADGATVGRVL
ncbi:hypothetical protein QCA50_009231 [Cerrena zonata]|uniref:Actin cytoskeleton-regulatory complex protein PAN1 n=1 Tax=Cerrena zonata TaxID=2478898 RepID=A0AAW0G2A6_9APHY